MPEHEQPTQTQHDEHDPGLRMYLRFGTMIATSTVVMFALTYTNAFAGSHVRFSEERVYMALLMGAAMAIVMLAFMWGMYRNLAINVGIVVAALALGGIALYLSRSQVLVDDESYMKAMIPHHSIAILTSERAGIEDVRVRELADGITRAQRKEIKEMTWLVQDIDRNGPATTRAEAEARPVPDFSGSAGGRVPEPGPGGTAVADLLVAATAPVGTRW